MTDQPSGTAALAALGEMSDKEFVYHYNKRHLADIKMPRVETWPGDMSIPSLRAFHQHCHRTTTDHTHEEEDSGVSLGTDGRAVAGGTKVRRRRRPG